MSTLNNHGSNVNKTHGLTYSGPLNTHIYMPVRVCIRDTLKYVLVILIAMVSSAYFLSVIVTSLWYIGWCQLSLSVSLPSRVLRWHLHFFSPCLRCMSFFSSLCFHFLILIYSFLYLCPRHTFMYICIYNDGGIPQTDAGITTWVFAARVCCENLPLIRSLLYLWGVLTTYTRENIWRPRYYSCCCAKTMIASPNQNLLQSHQLIDH